MTDDLISRQAAIDALNEYFVRIGKLKRRGLNKGEKAISLDTVGAINSLPPAQTEQHLDEWCTDCKEYDTERHCCPRWNKVIRQTLTIAQPEPCEDAVSRADILSMIDDMADDVNDGFGFAYEQWKEQVEELPPVTPKQRTDLLKAEIKRMKRSFTTCPNSDYYTGYMSALSAVEGYIAQLEGKE